MNDIHSGVEAAKTLSKITDLVPKDLFNQDITDYAKKLSIEMFKLVSNSSGEISAEAKFHHAVLIANSVPNTNSTRHLIKSDEMFSSLIMEVWNGEIDSMNLIPAVTAKYYYKLKNLVA